jgi:hypothetical protein
MAIEITPISILIKKYYRKNEKIFSTSEKGKILPYPTVDIIITIK